MVSLPTSELPEHERSLLLDQAIVAYRRLGYRVVDRSSVMAYLISPWILSYRRFSWREALRWSLLFGIGLVVYLHRLHLARTRRGHAVFLLVDQRGETLVIPAR